MMTAATIHETATRELVDALMMAFAENRLTRDLYDGIISELQTRDLFPETLATLETIAPIEWQHSRQKSVFLSTILNQSK